MKLISILVGLAAMLIGTAWAQSSPSDAITKYLSAWKANQPAAMQKVTQKRVHASLGDMKGITAAKKLLSYKIIKVDKVSYAMTRFTVKITYSALGQKPETHVINANVINEDGFWGVNYISALRED